jgi:hypothetical protein
MAAGLGLILRSASFTLRAGQVLQHALAIASRMARRQPPSHLPGSLLGFRDRAVGLMPRAAGGSPPPPWQAS